MVAFVNVQMGRRVIVGYLASDGKWTVNGEKISTVCKRRLTITTSGRPDPVHFNAYFFFALAVYVTDHMPELQSKWFHFKRPK